MLKAKAKSVLILVVMEYTQWDKAIKGFIAQEDVLILVVMEYTQWEWESVQDAWQVSVLILVVMEYTQWVSIIAQLRDEENAS